MQSTIDRRKKTQRIGGERRASDVARIAESLERRGHVSLCVHGTSMMPWVRPGDIAMIRTANTETLSCGHVVLFRRNNSLFVHRIVNKKGPLEAAQIFVKGDAHPTSDGLIEQGELLGRVVWLYRDGRRIDLELDEAGVFFRDEACRQLGENEDRRNHGKPAEHRGN